MKNKKIILLIGAIFLGILIGVISFISISKINAKKENQELEKAARAYFNDTFNSEVYAEVLVENGYLKKYDKKCILIKNESNEIVTEKSNCDKAYEEAKKPVIILSTTNDFKINEWNVIGTEMTFSFKNGGNSYYKESDITNVKWILESVGGFKEGSILNVDNTNQNQTFTLQIELKNGELVIEKKIDIKVDNEAPVLKGKIISWNSLIASYSDYSKVTGFYKVTEQNEKPSKDEMTHSLELDFECDKTYYGWAYAKDEAGNETDIEFVGEYIPKCVDNEVTIDSSLKKE